MAWLGGVGAAFTKPNANAPWRVPRGAVDAPGASVDVPGASVDAPGASVDAPGASVDAPGVSVDIPRGAVDAQTGVGGCLDGGAEARGAQQLLVGVGVGVAGGQQLVAVEDRVGARHKAHQLRLTR